MATNFKKETNTNDEWTMIISPKRNLFDFNLQELWRYKDLVLLFVRRDFVAKYKQTILGPLWFIIQPLLTTIMFTVVFGRIAGISTDGLPQMVFYMTGIVAWNYFSGCLNATSSTFTSNAAIFGKVYFPRLSIPFSVIISNLITFAIQFILLIVFIVYFKLNGAEIHSNLSILLIPFLIIIMAFLGLGFGIVISSLTTKYRDFTHLVSFGVQLWMYATPIVYPLSTIPDKYSIFIIANPMTSIIETFRYALLGSGTFNYSHLLYTVGFTITILIMGILMFNRVEKTFMDTV